MGTTKDLLTVRVVQISNETKMLVIVTAVEWGMSWNNAEEQLNKFLDGNDSIDTAQIQNVVNKMWYHAD